MSGKQTTKVTLIALMIAFQSSQALNYFVESSSFASVAFAVAAVVVAEPSFSSSYLVFAHLSPAVVSLAPVLFPSVASPSFPTITKTHQKD